MSSTVIDAQRRVGKPALVHVDFPAEKTPSAAYVAPKIGRCLIRFRLTGDPGAEIKMTGVYIRPASTGAPILDQPLGLSTC